MIRDRPEIEDRGNFISISFNDNLAVNLGKKQSFASGTGELDISENKGSVKLNQKDISLEREDFETEKKLKTCSLSSEKMDIELVEDNGRVNFSIEAEDADIIEFTIPARSNEKFFGMGEQFTGPELTGEEVPVVVQEQGIGRGKPVVSKAIEMISTGSSGHSTSTYFPLPRYISSRNYSLQLDTKDVSIFDFSSERVSIRVFDSSVEGKIFFGEDLKDLLENIGENYGTMRKPPNWTASGPVLGLQGGNKEVFRKLDNLRHVGAPVSAIWIQDWEGQRSTLAGKQLWWDWSLDEELYENWDTFQNQLERENIKLLGYINPYLVERDEECLFDVAKEKDLLLKNEDGEIIFEKLAGFPAGMLDLSKEETVEWIKKVIKKNLVDNGFDGWMADFGESMPFDSKPDDAKARKFHNEYAEKWIEINSEVAGENDCSFFCRTGFTDSLEKTESIWCGDQLTSWDEYDGMKSALYGILNAGLSGQTIIHSDTGGYHSFQKLGVGISRGEELLKRWTEMNTFTSMLRTHEGNQPSSNAQVYDEEVREHFAKFAKIFQNLSSYRSKLLAEAESSNIPVVRHMMLEFDEDECAEVGDQFMFGPEFLVAPLLEKGAQGREVYLPEGNWKHLWSKKAFKSKGEYFGFIAPLGEPPIFYRETSKRGSELANSIEQITHN